MCNETRMFKVDMLLLFGIGVHLWASAQMQVSFIFYHPLGSPNTSSKFFFPFPPKEATALFIVAMGKFALPRIYRNRISISFREHGFFPLQHDLETYLCFYICW